MVVGGDFSKDSIAHGNISLFRLNPFQLKKPATVPHGYRSCVTYISKKNAICCGTSGVDISTDGGMHWKLISSESFHVCQKAKKGKTIFLAGAGGRIAKLVP
jgi:hypothetical protein